MTLSTTQVDAIWNEMQDIYPGLGTSNVVWSIVYPKYLLTPDIQLRSQLSGNSVSDYWSITINFLLLVLLSEGIEVL